MANLTKCVICGKEYNYCPNCTGSHSWKLDADTHEHYQIYMTLNQYYANQITKEKAIDMLYNAGITADSDLSDLKPHVADLIKDIVTVKENTVLKKSKKSKLYDIE